MAEGAGNGRFVVRYGEMDAHCSAISGDSIEKTDPARCRPACAQPFHENQTAPASRGAAASQSPAGHGVCISSISSHGLGQRLDRSGLMFAPVEAHIFSGQKTIDAIYSGMVSVPNYI